jgi:hypothetical protein
MTFVAEGERGVPIVVIRDSQVRVKAAIVRGAQAHPVVTPTAESSEPPTVAGKG